MSVSIYYTARRTQKITQAEQEAINQLLVRYSVDEEMDEYVNGGEGHNWASFSIYDPKNPTEPDVIFEGSTELPNNSEDAIFDGVDHWASLLADIRNVLKGAEWHVHIDDHDLVWDEEKFDYDLYK
ncbi:hypothetical protein NCCP2222_25960 [Sporosarcina sp. NCCP-2222]|uniref:hypothetical protein n=1 Tax=Sporosarcina sp. NCCP-2222 TaxID=2935073 RepID=UPI00208BFECF|nr:hypothetical protein [Sporosarcina sp. NCCP-2222]GKV56649.1 hypothetical protein NCCP2222_25960 [Sporosarcina sp. NCCP-2222]